MAKVERPLFSDEATGRVGQAVTFKKGAVWNSIVGQYHRNKTVSPALTAQRVSFKSGCTSWRNLDEAAKQTYRDNAPTGYTGFQYYLSTIL